jgi:hypothetical protein
VKTLRENHPLHFVAILMLLTAIAAQATVLVLMKTVL